MKTVNIFNIRAVPGFGIAYWPNKFLITEKNEAIFSGTTHNIMIAFVKIEWGKVYIHNK